MYKILDFKILKTNAQTMKRIKIKVKKGPNCVQQVFKYVTLV